MRLAVSHPAIGNMTVSMVSMAHVTAISEASIGVRSSGPKQRVDGVGGKSQACMSACVEGGQRAVCRTQRGAACGT